VTIVIVAKVTKQYAYTYTPRLPIDLKK